MREGRNDLPDGLSLRAAPVRRLRRLLRRRSDRDAEQVLVAEGAKLLGAALDAKVPVEAVFVAPAAYDAHVVHRARAQGVALHLLAPGVVEQVGSAVTPQPVVAVVPRRRHALAELRGESLLVVSGGVQDPGNLGTLLRVAAAAGAGGVVCCGGSVDVYNPKAVRASAGVVFDVPVVTGAEASEVLDELGRWSLRRLGTRPRRGAPYYAVDLTVPTAIVVGNEARGLDDSLGQLIDEEISIPMAEGTESLNVASAAAVICFEAARQRRMAGTA